MTSPERSSGRDGRAGTAQGGAVRGARQRTVQRGRSDAASLRRRRPESDAGKPALNRHEKSGKDAAEWQPPQNQCWFAQRVIDVRRAYGLTIDQAEADALDLMLAGCTSTEIMCDLEPPPPPVPEHPPIQSFRNCNPCGRQAGTEA